MYMCLRYFNDSKTGEIHSATLSVITKDSLHHEVLDQLVSPMTNAPGLNANLSMLNSADNWNNRVWLFVAHDKMHTVKMAGLAHQIAGAAKLATEGTKAPTDLKLRAITKTVCRQRAGDDNTRIKA